MTRYEAAQVEVDLRAMKSHLNHARDRARDMVDIGTKGGRDAVATEIDEAIGSAHARLSRALFTLSHKP